MLNYYSSNYNETKKPYNQIYAEKKIRQGYNNKQRASSINIEKIKAKSKIMPTSNSLNKKYNNNTNNTTLKTISVNKQIQYKKKTPIKNINQIKVENNFFNSYNGISAIKDTSYKFTNKISKNPSINNLNKNMRISQGKSGSNNKLRRKMILSVDLNNKKNNLKNMTQINDINNNIKLITDTHLDNTNKNIDNNSNVASSYNNNYSNPTSNGAKNNNNINKNMNMNYSINKTKAISVNHHNSNSNYSNAIIKSPEKNYNSNIFSTYVGASDKKGRIQKNNLGNNKLNNGKKINLQLKQPLKLFEENSSMNLTTSGKYKVNFANSNNNEKKYIKPNLKSSSSFYKINYNNNYNNYDTNNYKFLKEVIDIQAEMEKNMKDNTTNSKSKKYNTIKHSFEKLLKLLGNTIFKNNNNIIYTFLEKILIGYHTVVSAFSLENRKLKQINYNLNEQYEKIAKDLFNSNKILKEKQKLIEGLQKKITFLESGKSTEKNVLNQKNNNLVSNTNIIPKINTEQNEKIFKLNEKNIEDLDALYFYDKVKMNKKKSVSIPKILIKQREIQDEEEEEDNEEDEERLKLLKHSLSNDEFINLGTIKFKSTFFNEVRDSFC